ncbi:MAG: IS200/IS605 family transposase [Acidobacteriota bacterium]
MPHSYSNLLLHVVFATKDRRPFINPALESRLFPYMAGIVRQLGGKPFLINGAEDHVHLLVDLPPTIAVSDAVGKLKGSSSHWVHETFPDRLMFAWQRGYAAFSVSKSHSSSVATYIEGQKEHHRKRSFHDEFVLLLRQHGISVDENYLWT